VLKEIRATGMDVAEEESRTWLLKLLAVEIGDEGTRKDDKDATPKELVIDTEYVVAETELGLVKIAVSLG
jgi:hypothetical protein